MVKKPTHKILIITLFMLFNIFSISNVFALDTIGANIQIVKNEIVPEPVEPGNDIVLKVMITNFGHELAKNVNINPQIDAPFYFKKSDFNRQNFAICSGCSYEATYYLSVNSNTISGIYPINFEVEYENGFIKKETIFVKIIGIPDFIFDYDEKQINYPKDNFQINLSLKNIGTGNARNLKITSLSENFLLTGTQSKYFNLLDANENKEVLLNFQANSNLKSGLYKIPFEISYLDELGNELKQNYDISINIKDSALINLQNLKIQDYQTNIFDEIIITGIIENSGDGDAKNVYAYIETDLEGYKKSFVGSLKSKEDSIIIFKLKSTQSGEFPIKLNIEYEDDRGVHTITEELNIKVQKPLNKLYATFSIIFLLASIFLIRKYIKRKNEKN